VRVQAGFIAISDMGARRSAAETLGQFLRLGVGLLCDLSRKGSSLERMKLVWSVDEKQF